MSIKDFETFAVSPFEVEGLTTRVVRVNEASNAAVNMNTGEVFEMRYIKDGEVKKHDPVSYIKLFKNNLPMLGDLSTPGLKLLVYLMYYAPINNNRVNIDLRHCMQFSGYSAKSQYYRGVVELLTKRIIARAVGQDGAFYTNPNVFFNGDRTKL